MFVAMDALSDLLQIVRLNGAFFYAVDAAEPWSARSLPARDLSPRILPESEHLISYHILTEGRAYAGLIGEAQVELGPGDVIIFPHGDAHVVTSERGVRVANDVRRESPAGFPFTVSLGGHGPTVASFFCGYLGCDRRPFNPLLAALPRQLHMRAMADPWQRDFTRRLAEESRIGRPGADCSLTRLAEVMFIEAVRRHLAELPPEQTGWLAGLRDPVVGRALTLLHARPGHPWSIAELARETASSRSSLARQFALFVGQPPMQYLTQWRMQVATNRLASSGATVAAIGAEVGYESEAAFSRAFKKATGLAPGAWREVRRTAPAG